jgi:murein DD-endopeptidase MepM/ murein hydrolase activator NlpD
VKRVAWCVLLVTLTACTSLRSVLLPALTPSPRPAVTPSPADHFDFPLDPNRFGPYIHNVTGPLDVDTRYGVTNPGLGTAGKCFVNRAGQKVPFDRLFHAGEDWFAFDASGQVEAGLAKDAPVHAVANGLVVWKQNIGEQGEIVVVEHLLAGGAPDSRAHVWSAYWHLDRVPVAVGQIVYRGDVIGFIYDQGANSHLHWEIRTWFDGSNLFPPTSAGGRGTCNGRVPGLGYTWDDIPARAAPGAWGYVDPAKFVKEHRGQ